MSVNRILARTTSNNLDNPNKNVCVYKVAEFLRAENHTKYLHTMDDLLTAIRRGFWTARSRKSRLVGKKKNTAYLREKCPQITAKDEHNIKCYIVEIPGHVFLVDATGRTLVDTAPSFSQNKEIVNFYAVY